MKDEIKERIKEYKEYLATAKSHHWRCLNPHCVEDMMNTLITEIESLDEKIGESYWVEKADNKQIEELNKEIKQLKQDYKDHTKILGDKLNDQIEYGKQDRKKIDELRTVLALYKLPDNILVKKYQAIREAVENLQNNAVFLCPTAHSFSHQLDKIPDNKKAYRVRYEDYQKLQQALAAKGKDG
jgi:chromosome segregation ATPase